MVFMTIHEYFEKNADQRSNQYILMSSIWKPAIITITYFLLTHVIGPWYMKYRKPYNIKKYVMAYNLLQVALNSYLSITVLYAFSRVPIKACIEIDYTESERGYRELNSAHLFYLIKLLDCVDTVFFVLRKSYRQMSFLHTYHHGALIMVSWTAAKYFGGGQSGWACVFNAIVHVFMYSYYFATAYDPKFKEIPMKKYLTQLQLLQFFLLLVFYGFSLFSSCSYSKIMSSLALSQAIIFIFLFGKFYYHMYFKSKRG